MANINEILQRAASLRDETALNSISPERAGGIMYDTLIALNELWLQQGSALVISKIYASVSAMEADTAPVSDLTGQPLRPGQIVVIASSDSDNGSVYRYNGTTSPSWTSVGKIGNLEPVDSLDSDSTSLPLAAHQGKVLDGKISQLGQDVKSRTQSQEYQITTTNQTVTLPVAVKNGNKVNIKISSSTLPITRVVIAQNVNDTSHRIYDENVSSVDFTFTSNDDVTIYYFIIISSAADNDSVNVSVEYGDYLQERIETISEKTDSLQIDSDALSLKVNGLGESDFAAPPALVYWVSDGHSSMNNYRYGSKVYKVKEGDVFNVTLSNGDVLYTIVALNSQKELIAAKSVYGDLANYKYRVEQGVEYLYFITSSPSTAKVKSWVEDNVLLDNVSYGNSIFADGYCYLSNGNLSVNADYSVSEFIPVNPGDVVFIDNINTTSSTLIIASFLKDDDNVIVGSSFVSGNINIAEKRVYKIPNNIRRIRVTKSDGDSATINILRRYNTQEYFDRQRNNILVDGFFSFDNSNWTIDTDKTFLCPVVSGTWSFSKDSVDYSEDNSVLCCRIIPLSFNGSNFEVGIGKTTQLPYTGVTVYATIAKDSDGSYLKVYRYNFTDSLMEEIVSKRVTLSEEITIGKQYFLKIIKETEAASVITILATNDEGDIIGQTSADNVQYWGAVTCIAYNGSARFGGLSFSITKAVNPKVSIIGDSFVEGSTMTTKTDRWCGMLAETIGADNCVIMGRGGASFTNDNKRFFAQLEKVNSCYTILEGVSNDMDYTYWLNGLKMLINLCLVNGSIPILTTYAPNDHDTSEHRHELINSVNQWVRNSGYIYFDVNKALSDDGVSFKTGYVLSDGIHPSQDGHLALFNRLKMDCPFLFE